MKWLQIVVSSDRVKFQTADAIMLAGHHRMDLPDNRCQILRLRDHLRRNNQNRFPSADFLDILRREVIIVVMCNQDEISVLWRFPHLKWINIDSALSIRDTNTALGKDFNVLRHLCRLLNLILISSISDEDEHCTVISITSAD